MGQKEELNCWKLGDGRGQELLERMSLNEAWGRCGRSCVVWTGYAAGIGRRIAGASLEPREETGVSDIWMEFAGPGVGVTYSRRDSPSPFMAKLRCCLAQVPREGRPRKGGPLVGSGSVVW